jgi:hypothetical protein
LDHSSHHLTHQITETRRRQLKNLRHNKALHLTAFPLRSKAAGELGS